MDSTYPFSPSSKLPIKRKTHQEPGSPTGSEQNPVQPPFKFHRIWTEPDEIRFLQGLLDGGSYENMWYPRDLNLFYTKFSNSMSQPYTKSQLSEKLRRLRKKFRVICARLDKGLDFKLLSPHDRALYDLSKQLWHPDFAQSSPFNSDNKLKKSNLVGVKVSFLPAFLGPGQGPNSGTHDGVSVSEEDVGVEVGLLPALPGPGQGPNSGTHDGFLVSEEDVGVEVGLLPTLPGLVQGPDQGPDGGRVTGKGVADDGVSVIEKENVEVEEDKNVNNDGGGDGELGDEDGMLREVNVELDRGDMGEKGIGGSFSDGPVKVGEGFGIGEIAAKVVVDVFDECLKDFRNGGRSNLGGVLEEQSLDKFEERWREQRVAELDVMARRMSWPYLCSLELAGKCKGPKCYE